MTPASRGFRAVLTTSAVLAALAVADGSPVRAQDVAPRGYAVQPFTPPGFRLPDDVGCAGAIARWQAVQANDYAGGNVSLDVYNHIQNEIDRASAVCEAGQDVQARRLVAESRRRHGYPQ